MRSKCINIMQFLALGLACVSASFAQSADYIDELKTCAKVSDRDARFTCYENLGNRALEDESAAKKSTTKMTAQPETAALPAAAETATSKATLPDDKGSSLQMPTQSKEQYSGLITSCKRNADGDWYFYFDNGQVWKQVDRNRLDLRECNFIVTITRGGFGYVMHLDSGKQKVRVSRRR